MGNILRVVKFDHDRASPFRSGGYNSSYIPRGDRYVTVAAPANMVDVYVISCHGTWVSIYMYVWLNTDEY